MYTFFIVFNTDFVCLRMCYRETKNNAQGKTEKETLYRLRKME